jgi:hypothetical protein
VSLVGLCDRTSRKVRHPFAASSDAIHNTFAYYSPMGGERGSTARQRMSGKICCMCSNSLPPDPSHCDHLTVTEPHQTSRTKRRRDYKLLKIARA